MVALPYCGAAPNPSEILTRFNLDPWLIGALLALGGLHFLWLKDQRHANWQQSWRYALSGWTVATLALVSPLCALSVALFSARVTQHMILILVAAPLIAFGLPRKVPEGRGWTLWFGTAIFFLALWFWHMPVPYEATFASTSTYWAMHVSLFGTSVLLWRDLLYHPAGHTPAVLTAGSVTFMHMGLLGAVLTLAERPLFAWHLTTTQDWGLTPLQDQQLGGAVMWVPGIVLFLWTAIRSIMRLWASIERTRPA